MYIFIKAYNIVTASIVNLINIFFYGSWILMIIGNAFSYKGACFIFSWQYVIIYSRLKALISLQFILGKVYKVQLYGIDFVFFLNGLSICHTTYIYRLILLTVLKCHQFIKFPSVFRSVSGHSGFLFCLCVHSSMSPHLHYLILPCFMSGC